MRIIKSVSTARRLLVITWFGFLLSNLCIIFYLFFDGWIEKDSFKAAMEQLNASYAPYVGAITLYYWATVQKGTQRTGQAGTAFTLAWLCSLIWNGVIIAFLLPLLFQSGNIEDSIEHIRDNGAMLSWLVAGAIGYYFANPTSSTN
jgi:hypothetical protein